MHTRDYSEDTSRVIDDEVERILRNEETRAMELLSLHQAGLTAVANALLELETIDGEMVGRLVDEAYGRPVYADAPKPVVPSLGSTPEHNGSGSGTPTVIDAPAPEPEPQWSPPSWPGSEEPAL
jgi:cell division protease FtsH